MGGREYVVKKLRETCGLSRRQAVVVLNTILERMTVHLRAGDTVEFPFGHLVKVQRHFSKYWDAVDDCPAGRDPYEIEWQVNQAGEREFKTFGSD